MIGSLCPVCGQPLPPRDVARCPVCGAEIVTPPPGEGLPRSKTLTHPIIGGSVELPITPQFADKYDITNQAQQRERSQLFTWFGCMGLIIALLGIAGIVFAILVDLQWALYGALGLILGTGVAILFYRRSLQLDRTLERDRMEAALRDFHHFEG